MSGRTHLVAHARPAIGAHVPGWSLKIALGVVGAAVCLCGLPVDGWLVLGLVLTLAAYFLPRIPAAWALILLAGAGALWREPSPLDLRFYLLLAGVHLLHILASYALVVPARGRLQVRAFGPPLRRYLLIQVPVQLGCALALFVFAPRAGQSTSAIPVAAAVAALALVAVTVLATGPLLRDKAREHPPG